LTPCAPVRVLRPGTTEVTMNAHDTLRTIRQFAHSLSQLEVWVEKTRKHAELRKFDADTLLQSRLAPDMFPLVRQIGSACDTAKLSAARLTGKAAPVHADDQKTWDDVLLRVRSVIGFIGDFNEADFAEADGKVISFPWYPGKVLAAEAYFAGHAIPNFHFHLAMAYAILRHNGVDVGKADFLGNLPFTDA
jgi:hypothetical protein